MKRKLAGCLLALFLLLSGVAAAYSQCVEINHRLDAATEHDSPSIHCSDVAHSSTQVPPSGRLYSGEPDSFLRSPFGRADDSYAGRRYEPVEFMKRFSQQDLYQLEEALRL